MDKLLTVKNLKVSFGDTAAVRGVDLNVRAGEIFALVGESGSGKTVTAQAILRLNSSAEMTADTLTLAGNDVLTASEKELDCVRGAVVGMVFQDPMTSLNPTMKVWEQITERLYRKEGVPRAKCREIAVRLLAQVQISDAELRANQYPHQLSGGMRQRVMIAMAIACNPRLLIADEPTTALDVTTQLQILRLLAQIRKDTGTAVLLITHDLGVVTNLCDRVAVMYAGRVVETGSVTSIFERAAHPYTKVLMSGLEQEEGISALSFLENAGEPVGGCQFAARCRNCMHICLRLEPPMLQVADEHLAACWCLHSSVPKEKADGKIT